MSETTKVDGIGNTRSVPRTSTVKIGVLALQGDFDEHVAVLRQLGAKAVEVRLPEQLEGVDALIIPGGESTTIGKLLVIYRVIEPIRALARSGRPILGTCAGAILLAHEVVGSDQPRLDLMNIVVERNAFGRQVDSFEAPLTLACLPSGSFPGIFIRGPLIRSVGEGVRVLSKLEDGTIVAAQQDNLLALAFHPELSSDPRLHQYFLELAALPTQ